MTFAGDPVCPDAVTIDELDEDSIKKAKDELHEDPKDRMGAIETLRTWVLQQPHLTCRTDNRYLLKYLRGAKFSQLKARDMLEGTLQTVTENQDWFKEIDPADPIIQKIIGLGTIIHMPGRTPDGCALLIYRMSGMELKPEGYTVDDEMKAMLAVTAYTLSKPWVQVNGIVFFMDYAGATIKHMTRWGSWDKMMKVDQAFQNKIPGRYKKLHNFNAGPVFETIWALMKTFMKQKFIDRFVMHSTLESVYKHIPLHLLPDEYLPDEYDGPSAGTFQSITEHLKKDMRDPSFRDWMIYESHPKWKYDSTKKPSKSEPQASFRKLNID